MDLGKCAKCAFQNQTLYLLVYREKFVPKMNILHRPERGRYTDEKI